MRTDYLPGITIDGYLAHMRVFPRFLPALDLDGVAEAGCAGNEFDSDVDGRGDSYRVSQQHCDVRLTGILALLERALGQPVPARPRDDLRVLDALGGDGTLARAVAGLFGLVDDRHWILTGDLSRNMVAEALRYRLPAICQPAQRLLLRDDMFDAVILGYGTHHIPPAERKTAYAEAWRVLRPGGRLVVHDFEEQGPVARWFEHVVHAYAPGGHRYQHFTRDELHHDLATVGFRGIDVGELYDPFVVTGPTRQAAGDRLVEYVGNMYGLFGLRSRDDWRDRLWRLMRTYLRYPANHPVASVCEVEVRPGPGGHVATMPRVALTATAVKHG